MGLVNLLSSSIWGGTNASPIWFGPLVIFTLFASTTFMNLLHVGNAARLNNLFTLLKFAMAFSFAALVLFSPSASLSNVLQIASPTLGNNLIHNVASVFMLALAGFAGVEMIGCTSSETSNAEKTVPRAMLMTLAAVTLIYVGMCVAVSAASPYILNENKTTMVIAGTNIQATCPSITSYLAGPLWGNIFSACVVASIVGCGFSCLLGTAPIWLFHGQNWFVSCTICST